MHKPVSWSKPTKLLNRFLDKFIAAKLDGMPLGISSILLSERSSSDICSKKMDMLWTSSDVKPLDLNETYHSFSFPIAVIIERIYTCLSSVSTVSSILSPTKVGSCEVDINMLFCVSGVLATPRF